MATRACEVCEKPFEPQVDYFTRQLGTLCLDCEQNEAEAAHWRAEIERCGGPAAFPEYFERRPDGTWKERDKKETA